MHKKKIKGIRNDGARVRFLGLVTVELSQTKLKRECIGRGFWSINYMGRGI